MNCYIFSRIEDKKVIKDILKLRNISFKETYEKEIEDPWDNYDINSHHFLVYDNDSLVGYYRLRQFNSNVNDTLASKRIFVVFGNAVIVATSVIPPELDEI